MLQTRVRVANADVGLLLVDPDFAPFLEPEPGDPPMVLLNELDARGATYERPKDDPDALAILQFTSGSTSLQDITSGPDGALWFDAGSSIGRMTTSGTETLFDVSEGTGGTTTGITTGSDGALWFGRNLKIGRITTGGSFSMMADVPAA